MGNMKKKMKEIKKKVDGRKKMAYASLERESGNLRRKGEWKIEEARKKK